MKKQNLIGQQFGELTVIASAPRQYSKSGKSSKTMWLCQCSCSNQSTVGGGELKKGNTTSCGCQSSRTTMGKRHGFKPTHNLSNHRLYKTWYNMNDRCYNPSNPGYHNYGGKGVTVCPEWHKDNPDGLRNFINDMQPSYQEGLQIDKDILGDGLLYSKKTCQWTSHTNNSRHRSTVKLSLDKAEEIRCDSRPTKDIADDLDVGKSTVWNVKAGNTWN